MFDFHAAYVFGFVGLQEQHVVAYHVYESFGVVYGCVRARAVFCFSERK